MQTVHRQRPWVSPLSTAQKGYNMPLGVRQSTKKNRHLPLSRYTGLPKLSARSVPTQSQREQPTIQPPSRPLYRQPQVNQELMGERILSSIPAGETCCLQYPSNKQVAGGNTQEIVPILRLWSRYVDPLSRAWCLRPLTSRYGTGSEIWRQTRRRFPVSNTRRRVPSWEHWRSGPFIPATYILAEGQLRDGCVDPLGHLRTARTPFVPTVGKYSPVRKTLTSHEQSSTGIRKSRAKMGHLL